MYSSVSSSCRFRTTGFNLLMLAVRCGDTQRHAAEIRGNLQHPFLRLCSIDAQATWLALLFSYEGLLCETICQYLMPL